jgi:hypothetical protein
MRFVYRGQGESTGRFEDSSFSDWLEDLAVCASWLRQDHGQLPLILCGLRLGGLLASNAFSQGLGDILLLWSPPASGRAMLTEMLRRRVAADLTTPTAGPRKTREQYIADLEADLIVEVEGYCWTKRLWEQAADFVLRHERAGESPAAQTVRPWRSLILEPGLGQIAGNLSRVTDPVRRVHISPLNIDLEPFFAGNIEWLRSMLVARTKAC